MIASVMSEARGNWETLPGSTYGYSQGAAMLQVHLTMPPNERALRGGLVGGGNEMKLDRLHVLSCWGW
jgi:hypothetical protein